MEETSQKPTGRLLSAEALSRWESEIDGHIAELEVRSASILDRLAQYAGTLLPRLNDLPDVPEELLPASAVGAVWKQIARLPARGRRTWEVCVLLGEDGHLLSLLAPLAESQQAVPHPSEIFRTRDKLVATAEEPASPWESFLPEHVAMPEAEVVDQLRETLWRAVVREHEAAKERAKGLLERQLRLERQDVALRSLLEEGSPTDGE